MSPSATEFEFILPRGYLTRTGVMRLATARDELVVLRDHSMDPMTPASPSWSSRESSCPWGTMETVPPDVIELVASDLAYLQEFYAKINFGEEEDVVALTESGI